MKGLQLFSYLLLISLQVSGQDALTPARLPEAQVVGEEEESRLGEAGQSPSLLLGPETIRQSALPSVADLLRQQGGVSFTSFFGSTGTGVPQLRGFGENASPRVLILVDGLPMTRPDLAAPVWFEFPIAGLEQVELQRGARTVRYGSSALAGVISLETRRRAVQTEWSLQASYGSWNTSLFRVNGLIPSAHGWTTGISLDWFERDGWRENSAIKSHATQFSLSSPQDRAWQWRTTLNASETELENPGGLTTRAYEEDPRQSVFARFGIGEQLQNFLTTLRSTHQMSYQPNPDELWTLNASWTGRERELNFGAGSHTDHDLVSFAFDLAHEWQCQKISSSWGIRGSFDTLFLERFRDQDRRDRFATSDLERLAFGAFARSAFQVNPKVTLSGGVSWDTYNLDATVYDSTAPNDPLLSFDGHTNDSAWGAELALEFRPSEQSRLWLRYDRVFRFPVLDEIAGYQGFILEAPINSDLSPETGHGLELGTSWKDERLTASLTAFAQWLDGEIIFDFNNNLNTNFADSRRIGIESRFVWQGDGWTGLVNYQWTDARFVNRSFSRNVIPLIPGHQLSFGLTWNPGERFETTLEWEWLDDSFEGGDFANTQTKLPGRSLINLESRYLINESIEIYGRVDNLFDEQWASLKFLGQWYPGNGQSITIGARFTF
ncbi:MAG: TonB-dependent receptor [Akkermansiaceae bacterium]